jgi:hypothetical protein
MNLSSSDSKTYVKFFFKLRLLTTQVPSCICIIGNIVKHKRKSFMLISLNNTNAELGFQRYYCEHSFKGH